MARKLVLGFAGVLLGLSATIAVVWWVAMWRARPFLDWKVVLFLAGAIAVQLSCWCVALGFRVRAERIPSTGVAWGAAVFSAGSMCTNLLYGYNPAFGAPLALLVMLLGIGWWPRHDRTRAE
jgi:hypothetical protein